VSKDVGNCRFYSGIGNIVDIEYSKGLNLIFFLLKFLQFSDYALLSAVKRNPKDTIDNYVVATDPHHCFAFFVVLWENFWKEDECQKKKEKEGERRSVNG
jgi:hypothetical protein